MIKAKNTVQFDPALMILLFCYSVNSDLSMLLRSRGVFGSMFVRHEMRLITRNLSAKIDPARKKLIGKLGGNWTKLV